MLRISVYQNPDLTLETRITEAGVVSYPLLGSVRIGGLSVTAAEKLIADGLRNGNFVKQPQVTLVWCRCVATRPVCWARSTAPAAIPSKWPTCG